MITLNTYSWHWNASSKYWYYDLPVSYDYHSVFQITAMSYIVFDSGDNILPCYNPDSGTTFTYQNRILSNGQIRFLYYDGTTTLTAPSSDVYISISIIK